MTGQYRGAILVLAAYALMTAETVAIHHVGSAATPLQFILARNVSSVALVWWLARGDGWAVFHTGALWLQFVRGGLSMVSLWCLFYGFAALPLADATAVTYTRAVFLTLLAAVVLREPTSPKHWISLGVGAAGGFAILHPAFAAWSPGYLVALIGAALNAGAMVATKALERRDSTLTIMAWLTAIATALSLPALADAPLPAWTWPWLAVASICGTLGLYAGLMAIRASSLSVLAPFDYSRLVMAAALGWLFFDEMPNLSSLAGAAAIAGACVWVAVPKRIDRAA